MEPLIVVAGFKREFSIRRLLKSLLDASYPHDNVKICLSLDGGYSEGVLSACEQFKHEFSKGFVEIVCREKNLGLRNHIIWCGDQSVKHGSVIVLEDDLIVDPQFYNYAVSALSFYESNDEIAGVSLYSQEYNEYSGQSFRPLQANFSGYFMKVPCSWGQAWTCRQWTNFKNWYSSRDESHINLVVSLPDKVKSWPETSWKKYYAAYISVENLWFFYPYRSYSTNSSDPGGEHNTAGTNVLQTNTAFHLRSKDEFSFPLICNKKSIFYDEFMEPVSAFLYDALGFKREELGFDLYATKPIILLKNKKYALTTRSNKIYLDRFYLHRKPFENSVLFKEKNMKGVPVYLVETENLLSDKKLPYIPLLSYLTGINYFSRSFIKSFFFGFLKEVSKRLFKK